MKEKSNRLKKMWQDKRKKALIKFGIWVVFFFIMALLVFFMQLFETKEIKPPKENEKYEKETVFTPLEVMWKHLETEDYHYHYQIEEMGVQEKIIYEGEKKQNVDLGYRESKLGIVKYKIVDEKTYQIFLEEEIEMNDLFLNLEKDYLTIKKIHNLCLNPILEEKRGEQQRLICQNEMETIKITTNKTEIIQIEILKNPYAYQLIFQKI